MFDQRTTSGSMFARRSRLPARVDRRSLPIHRRHAIAAAMSTGIGLCAPNPPRTIADDSSDAAPSIDRSRARGMLMGSIVGDAWGGPIEFVDVQQTHRELFDRSTDELLSRTIDQVDPSVLTLLSYERFRPQMAPYGHWRDRAPAGTVTDDTRLKHLLCECFKRNSPRQGSKPPSAHDIAETFLADVFEHPMADEWLAEYRRGCRGLLQRDGGPNPPDDTASNDTAPDDTAPDDTKPDAIPPEYLWGGVSNCSGQMMLTPIAITAAASRWSPEQTYRYVDSIAFFDAPPARDLIAGLVAGLSELIKPNGETSTQRRVATLRATMIQTDPHHLAKTPFIGRQLTRWIELAESIAHDADGNLGRWVKDLHDRGKPRYYWDAHFTFVAAWSALVFARWKPMSAFVAIAAMGYDTDSYAQLAAAIAGAVLGDQWIPNDWIETIRGTMANDFQSDPETWINTFARGAV